MILEIKGSPKVAELVSCLSIGRFNLLPSYLNYYELSGQPEKKRDWHSIQDIQGKKPSQSLQAMQTEVERRNRDTEEFFLFPSFPPHSFVFQCHIQRHIVFKNHEIAVLRNVVAKERDE